VKVRLGEDWKSLFMTHMLMCRGCVDATGRLSETSLHTSQPSHTIANAHRFWTAVALAALVFEAEVPFYRRVVHYIKLLIIRNISILLTFIDV
jgi:hypothetical protein